MEENNKKEHKEHPETHQKIKKKQRYSQNEINKEEFGGDGA